jgi:hypothetical protein
VWAAVIWGDSEFPGTQMSKEEERPCREKWHDGFNNKSKNEKAPLFRWQNFKRLKDFMLTFVCIHHKDRYCNHIICHSGIFKVRGLQPSQTVIPSSFRAFSPQPSGSP